MSLTTHLAAEIRAHYTKTFDQADGVFDPRAGGNLIWTDGTAINQANALWCDTRTLAKAASESLDLAGGLANAFGESLTFARVKALLVTAATANVGTLVIKSVVATPTIGFRSWLLADGDGVVVRPGGTLLLLAPDATAYVVTAGTGDLLTITNSDADNAATYTICLVGATS